LRFSAALLAGVAMLLFAGPVSAEPPKPLKILLITGGCCHDYPAQKDIIKEALEKRANVEVTDILQGGVGREVKIPLYENANWADGYDLIIHDECFGEVTDVAWSERVLAPHQKGVPAVLLHCAMHCYRNGTENWHEFCGVTTRRHGAAYPHDVTSRDPASPIMKNFPAVWDNPAGELYWIEKVWDTAHPLTTSHNKEKDIDELSVWTNDYRGTRVFATTLGHHNETVESPEYLELITRGSLWACDKLNDDYLKK
jgi:type 1 glutamine amidotransferase